ncbi:MAG: TadE/TadG family type IV pilus assembly protein [Kineosporiaceae bacterium]
MLRRGDTGSGSVELALVFPVLLLVVLGLVQGGLHWHARNVALAAAQEGVGAARVEGAGAAAGETRAEAFLVRAGGTELLTAVTVTSRRDAATAEVTVSGTGPSIVPGLPGWPVVASAAGPVERWRSPG